MEHKWSDFDGLYLDLCVFIKATFEEMMTMKFVYLQGQFQGHRLLKYKNAENLNMNGSFA